MTNTKFSSAAPVPELVHLPTQLALTRSEEWACPLCMGQEQKILSRHNGKSLRRCLNCEVAFVHPQPSSTDLAAHFEDARQTSHDDVESNFETNREEVLARVADYIYLRRPPGRIVDV